MLRENEGGSVSQESQEMEQTEEGEGMSQGIQSEQAAQEMGNKSHREGEMRTS